MRKNIFSLCLVFCMVLCTINYKTVTVMAGDCDYSDCDENDKTCKLNNAKKKQQCLQNDGKIEGFPSKCSSNILLRLGVQAQVFYMNT